MSTKFECRDIGIGIAGLEYRAQGRKLGGYAARYESESHDLGGFTEVISRGAFRNVLQANPDVILTFNHDPNYILGRTGAGTLHLNEDSKGLHFEADLADTQLIRDMVLSPMQRGELKSMSFAFRVGSDGQAWGAGANGLRKRTITNFRSLHDVSIVTNPSYPSTSVSFRSPQDVLSEIAAHDSEDYRIDLYRRRLELAGGKQQRKPGDYKLDLYKRKIDLLSL